MFLYVRRHFPHDDVGFVERNLQNRYESFCTRKILEMASDLGNGVGKMGNVESQICIRNKVNRHY